MTVATLQTGRPRLREVTGRPQGHGRLLVSGRGRRSAGAGPVPQALGCRPWPPDAPHSVEKDPRGAHRHPGRWYPGTTEQWENGCHLPGAYNCLHLLSVNAPQVKVVT